MRATLRAVMLLLALPACGGKHDDSPPPAPTSCDPGFDLREGRCLPHFDDCGGLAVPIRGGGCAPSGVPPEECGAGFASDGKGGCVANLPKATCGAAAMAVPGDTACIPVGVETCASGFGTDGAGGCTAIVPKDACAKGTMAVPGEASCREVAGCGTGTFGDIPDDPSTLYVDASYLGGGSDGSKSKPFLGVQAALDAASSTTSSTIAIAGGTYAENLTVNKPVSLRGRCPSMVELHGEGDTPTVLVTHDTVTLNGFAVSSANGSGIDISAMDASIDHVWMHDTARFCLFVWRKGGDSKATVRDSLCEVAREAGFGVQGGVLAVESSAVRETSAGTSLPGMGIVALDDNTTKVRSTLSVRGSIVERSVNTGIGVAGSVATIESTLVRDVTPRSDGLFGRGIDAHDTISTKAHAELTMLGCVIERTTDGGIVLTGATAVIDSTVVRDTRTSSAPGAFGHGIVATTQPSLATAANLTLRSSLVERSVDLGLHVAGSVALIEKTIVRDTGPGSDGTGAGVFVGGDHVTKAKASVTLRRMLIDHNAYQGVSVVGADAILEQLLVRGSTAVLGHPQSGFGLSVTPDERLSRRGNLSVHGSVVSGNTTAGVLVDAADATITETLVADTKQIAGADPFGRGIVVQNTSANKTAGGSGTLRSVVVEGNSDVGIFIGNSLLSIESTTVRDTFETSRRGSGVGIAAQSEPDAGLQAELTLRRSIVDGSTSSGVALVNAKGTFERTIVRGTKTMRTGEFGDGIYIGLFPGAPLDLASKATIVDSILTSNGRAGTSTFASSLTLTRSLLSCNAFDLDLESLGTGLMATVVDGGDNQCGCGTKLGFCVAQTHSLEPIPTP